jgi:hypothetical protein
MVAHVSGYMFEHSFSFFREVNMADYVLPFICTSMKSEKTTCVAVILMSGLIFRVCGQ